MKTTLKAPGRPAYRYRQLTLALALVAPLAAWANEPDTALACRALPSHAALKAALDSAVTAETTGLNLQMWATLVNRSGVVCAVAHSGATRGAQWPGSRAISAQKANTANAFSLDATSAVGNASGAPTGLVLSSANLYSPVQPGGSLFGLQESNPVNIQLAYSGAATLFGTPADPMVGGRIGGVNVFGGGLALYAEGRKLVGGVGLSGDTSCADHRIAWRVRAALGLDHMAGVAGVSGDVDRPDNIVYLLPGELPNGYKHPDCGGGDLPSTLAPVRP